MIRLNAVTDHAQALHAQAGEAEQAILGLVEIHDAGQGADRVDADQFAARFIPFVNGHHAEATVGSHAAADQVQIAGLENPQRQHTAGKQHGFKREQRQFLGGRRAHGFTSLPGPDPSAATARGEFPTDREFWRR